MGIPYFWLMTVILIQRYFFILSFRISKIKQTVFMIRDTMLITKKTINNGRGYRITNITDQ